MNKSDSIKALADALVKAQSQIKGAVKDSENPHFKSKYADLASVWDACREALTANGLAVIQAPSAVEGGVALETMLVHSSGEWISETLSVPVQKQDAQGFGSALTYCRRYGLASMVGVAPEDDDGNAAASAKQEGKFKPKDREPGSKEITARGGARDRLDDKGRDQIDKLAGRILDAFDKGDEVLAFTMYLDVRPILRGDADAQAAFWDKFDSKQRSSLKKQLEAMTAEAGAQA